jgi:hypothetical protein
MIKLPTKKWTAVFDMCVSNSDSIYDAVEWFKCAIRDEHPTKTDIRLSPITESAFENYIEWFINIANESDLGDNPEGVWMENDFAYADFLLPLPKGEYYSLDIPEKKKTRLEVTMAYRKASSGAANGELAGTTIELAEHLQISQSDLLNPHVRPTSAYRWSRTAHGHCQWVYKG